LVVQVHFEGSLLPITVDQDVVFSRVQGAIEGEYSSLRVFAVYPTIAVNSILGYEEHASPDVVIAVVAVVFAVSLHQTEHTVGGPVLYLELAYGNGVFGLFDDASKGV
jgi:hypothetical protein